MLENGTILLYLLFVCGISISIVLIIVLVRLLSTANEALHCVRGLANSLNILSKQSDKLVKIKTGEFNNSFIKQVLDHVEKCVDERMDKNGVMEKFDKLVIKKEK